MKIFKYGLGLLLSVMLLSSCETKWEYFTPTNEDVTWKGNGVTVSLDNRNTPIVITLQRGVAKEALSVPITLTDPYNKYTLSTNSVSFAAGEYSKDITLTYDYSTLEAGVEYTFTLSFNNSIAGPGSFSTYNGLGMMKLEYADFRELEYYYWQYVNASATAWEYRMGSLNDYLDNTKVKLQRALGTDSPYYKLIVFDDIEIEFKNSGEGDIIFNKYDGYNDAANKYDAANAELYYYVTKDGDTFMFETAEKYCGIFDASGNWAEGNEIGENYTLRFGGWIAKNGSWWPNGYNNYRRYWVD